MVYHTHVNPNHMVYRQGVIYHFLGVIYHIRTFQMRAARSPVSSRCQWPSLRYASQHQPSTKWRSYSTAEMSDHCR